MIARELPRDEWGRLDATMLAPVWRYLEPTDRVCILEEGGRIVGHWVVAQRWHVEGFWLARPNLFRRLWRLVGVTLIRCGARQVWTGAADGDTVVHELLARLGASRLPMDHFVVNVQMPESQSCQSLH